MTVFGVSRPRESYSGSPVVPVGIDQSLIAQGAIFRVHVRARRGIEVRPLHVSFPWGSGKFIPYSQIEREVASQLPVILHIPKVHALVDIESSIRVLLIANRKAQQQVGECILPSPVGARESPVKVELSEQRAYVSNAGLYKQDLAAESQGCAPRFQESDCLKL